MAGVGVGRPTTTVGASRALGTAAARRWAGAAARQEADDEGDADEGAPASRRGSCC
ncbi:MAG: hypothetical protein HZY76_11965 [Anaerolineae bacterium]|nr:MAG: hypothetical protein HZY76_11965 [Anaerolineae bacterium]